MKRLIWGNIWVILILSLFCFPAILSVVFETKGSTENRALSSLPGLSVRNVRQYPALFTKYFEDNLPFKQGMVFVYNSFLYSVFDESGVDSVIVGKDGWLFYNSEARNDGSTITEYKRTKQYTQKELAKIAENVKRQSEYLRSYGKELVIMIIPNKEEVYSRYMPERIKRQSKASSCDELVRYLENNTDVKIVCPKEEMIAAAQRNDVRIYQKYDTHWNPLGAFIGAKKLEETLTGRCLSPSTSYVVDGYSNKDGLSQMLNVAEILEPEEQYRVPEYQRDNQSIIQKSNKIKMGILFVGDSFRNVLKPFLIADFSHVEESHRDKIEKDRFITSEANIVVLEYVERYADQLKTYSFY